MSEFSAKEIEVILNNLDSYSELELSELYRQIDELEKRKYKETCQNKLLAFCLHMMEEYKTGAHHRKLAKLLTDIETGKEDRIIVNIAPRHGKSLLVSEFFIAWYLGKNPKHFVILESHTAELAVDFGRKVRNMIATERYQEIFPEVSIATDSKSAGRWNTNQGGVFFASGVGGALAGRGAHLLCLTGDSEVKVKGKGIIPVRHLSLDDEIATISGWEKVTKKWLTIHKTKVKTNSVEASMDHPFMTSRGWVCAGELQLGDRILTQTFWRRLWITANSLRKRLLGKRGKA